MSDRVLRPLLRRLSHRARILLKAPKQNTARVAGVLQLFHGLVQTDHGLSALMLGDATLIEPVILLAYRAQFANDGRGAAAALAESAASASAASASTSRLDVSQTRGEKKKNLQKQMQAENKSASSCSRLGALTEFALLDGNDSLNLLSVWAQRVLDAYATAAARVGGGKHHKSVVSQVRQTVSAQKAARRHKKVVDAVVRPDVHHARKTRKNARKSQKQKERMIEKVKLAKG